MLEAQESDTPIKHLLLGQRTSCFLSLFLLSLSHLYRVSQGGKKKGSRCGSELYAAARDRKPTLC